MVWNTQTGRVYFASTQTKMIETFLDLFTRTFELRLEQLLPYSLALSMFGEGISAKLDDVQSTKFI